MEFAFSLHQRENKQGSLSALSTVIRQRTQTQRKTNQETIYSNEKDSISPPHSIGIFQCGYKVSNKTHP